ncbi:uncharacterized protein LOC117889607 [Drosophila subobscura]|uniref:uncharacterized protein LOC117889607 n=1 Tax=Drosophila subobscura TaxID=7241 RepID=UPI00155B3F6E|nr:uncharacterized protein LOC117889607 [Drosophila subobscura]
MSDIKSCLKVCFQGETSFIICEAGNSYEEVIVQAMARFGIPETQKEALLLTNGKGYIFEAQLLEYFLLLFPCPEITFHLRLSWQKLRRGLNSLSPAIKRKRHTEPATKLEQAQAKASAYQPEEYTPVAVYRQNCFLGSLPSSSSEAAPVRRQNCFLREQLPLQQQQQLQLQREAEIGARQEEPQAKRLRLDVCVKPKRSASIAPLPAMRSIRI